MLSFRLRARSTKLKEPVIANETFWEKFELKFREKTRSTENSPEIFQILNKSSDTLVKVYKMENQVTFCISNFCNCGHRDSKELSARRNSKNLS